MPRTHPSSFPLPDRACPYASHSSWACKLPHSSHAHSSHAARTLSHARTCFALGIKFVQSKTTPSFFIATHAHSDIVSNYLRKSRFWEGGLSTVMLHVLASLPKHYAVVDFGANLGWFSLLASSQGHRVLAVEAMSQNRAALKAGAFKSGISLREITPNATMQPVRPNSQQTVMTTGEQILLAGAALVAVPDGPPVCIKSRTSSNIGNGVIIASDSTCAEEVPATTLDTLAAEAAQRWGVRHVDVSFVKADCEGCEAAALLGFATTLRTHRPPCALFIEYRPVQMRLVSPAHPPEQLTSLLRAAGYIFYQQHGHLVTGAGLRIVPLNDSTFEASKGCDLLFLHDSTRCFAQGGERLAQLQGLVAAGPLF